MPPPYILCAFEPLHTHGVGLSVKFGPEPDVVLGIRDAPYVEEPQERGDWACRGPVEPTGVESKAPVRTASVRRRAAATHGGDHGAEEQPNRTHERLSPRGIPSHILE
jgi:hypothetical protein